MPQNTKDPREIGVSGLTGLGTLGADSIDNAQPSSIRLARRLNVESTLNTPAVQDVGLGSVRAGESRIERGEYLTPDDFYNIDNYRGENQAGIWQLANGAVKAGVLGATTFLQGTIGLVNGFANALAEWDASKFWDNEFNRSLKAINDWSEKAFPNYYTDDERENPLALRNIFSWNSLGDKLIKNLGFTVGAFYSGGIWSRPLSAINAIKRLNIGSHVASGLGAILSAVNEGSFEALNNSEDWFNLQKARLDEQFDTDMQDVELFRGTTNYDILRQRVIDKYNASIDDLRERQKHVGNADLLMNLPILLASNLVEFGKLYARGFNTAKTTGKIVGRPGEYLNGMTTFGKIVAGVKAATSEGVEEVSQQFASNLSGNLQLPNREYNLSMYGAGIDSQAQDETNSFIKAFGTAMQQTLVDDWQNTAEQFLIGALTGALGMPTFGRANNENAYLGKGKLVGLSGGAIGAIRDYNKQRKDTPEIVDYMNSRVKDPKFKTYYQGMLRHRHFQDSMDAAAGEDKAKEYKDAEYAQMISDIDMFDRAGKIDDYISLVNEAVDTSDENLESIITNTTRPDGTGPFIDRSGNKLTATDEGKEQMKIGLIMRRKEMLDAVNQYRKVNESLLNLYGDRFSEDQRRELVWLSLLSENQRNRASEIAGDNRGLIDSLINTYKKQIDEIDISGEYHGQPITGKELDRRNKLQDSINYLERLKATDNESLANHIAQNDSLLIGLIESNISRLSDSNAALVTESLKNLSDIPALIKDSNKYAQKLKEYLDNPVKIEQEQQKEVKKEAKKTEQRRTNRERNNLNRSRTFDEIRQILLDSKESNDVLERAMSDSSNPIVQEYKQLRNRVNGIRENLRKNSTDDTAIADATALLDAVMSSARSIADFDLDSEIFKDVNNLKDVEGQTSEDKLKRLNAAVQLIRDTGAAINDGIARAPMTEVLDFSDMGEIEMDDDMDYDIPSTGDSDVASVTQVSTKQEQQQSGNTQRENIGAVVQSIDNSGNSTVRVNDNVFEGQSPENTESKQNIVRENNSQEPEKAQKGQVQKYWYPAVSQYDLAGMSRGEFVLNDNEEWQRVHAYIEADGGYEFINSGEYAKYAANGGNLYFGIDTEFDTNIVFIYAKINDTYKRIGSLFVSQYKTDTFNRMTDFIKTIKNDLSAQENPPTVFISQYTFPALVANIMRGRVPFDDRLKPVSEALDGSEITTPNIVVITDEGVSGASDSNVVLPDNPDGKKFGQAYIEVPNSKRGYRGGKSLISVVPVQVTRDVIDRDTQITNEIRSSIRDMANAVISGNRDELATAMITLSDNVLIQDIEFSLSPDNTTLFVNKVKRDSNNRIVKKTGKNGKDYNATSRIAQINIATDDVYNRIVDALVNSGVKIRINKSKLGESYSRELIDNGLIQTYATRLKVEASWFKIDSTLFNKNSGNASSPIEEASKQNTTPSVDGKSVLGRLKKKNVNTSEKKVDKDADKPKEPKLIKDMNTGERRELTPAETYWLETNHSKEWLDNATPEEIENALNCF